MESGAFKHSGEVLRESLEYVRRKSQQAAIVEVEAREAGDQVDWSGEPKAASVHAVVACAAGVACVALAWHCCRDRGGGHSRKIAATEPACEPRAPALLCGTGMSKTSKLLQAGQ